MSKKMLIDARHPEETRVALLSGGKVEDFDFESLSRRPLRGNIYLARVTRVEPSLQAAFVEYGGNRHGFLAFSEIHPDYYQIPVADRDVLRAAEALEAELAEKLAEYDDQSVDVADDDDEPDTDVSESDDSEEASAASTEESDDDEDSRPRRRGRRRRGRGRRGRSSGADDNGEAESRASEDGEGDKASEAGEDQNADARDGSNESDAKAEANDDEAEVQPAEDTSWHGADEDVIAATEADTEETAETETAQATETESAGDTTVTDDEVTEASEDGDTEEKTSKKDGPSSIALSAKVEPQVTADLPADDEEEDDNEDDAAAAEDADTVEARQDTSDDEDSSEETTGEAEARQDDESDDDGETADDSDEDDAVAKETSEEQEEVAARADEIAELQKRYEAARRERDRLLKNYRIQEVIKRRQIMLVQVVKEERGNKGAALTTYLSLAGRYGVLMPNNSRGGGVSRKISNQSDRRRLRKAIADLKVPKGQGLIIRTAGAKRTKAEIKRDYDYLARLWDTIRNQTLNSVAPCLIYEEASLIKRAIRDLYDKDTSEVLVEGDEGYREAKDFMKMLMPSHAKNVQPYRDKEPLFLRYGVEKQLDEMYQPVVQLKSGGYLVIQQTEALISVDVNSGKATKERNVEATALKTNTEAAQELARQCRLRDLAGLIVVDFIDMDENRNNRTVEKKFKDALKADRARIQVGSISNFGLLEMSRQRRRSGIVDGTTRQCPTCDGSGFVRSVEMAALRILRGIEEKAVSDRAGHVAATTCPEVALYILNQKRSWLNRMESSYGVTIEIISDHEKAGDQYEVKTSGQTRDVETLRQPAVVEVSDLDPDDQTDEDTTSEETAEDTTAKSGEDDDKPKRRRRRRSRSRKDNDDESTSKESGDETDGESSSTDTEDDDQKAETSEKDGASRADGEDDSGDEPKRKRRRGRRGGRGRKSSSGGESEAKQDQDSKESETGSAEPVTETESKADNAKADSDAPSDTTEETGSTKDTATDEEPAAAETVAETETKAESETEAEPVTDEAAKDDDKPAEPPRAASSIHAPLPEEDEKKKEGPKRGGWWQRAFRRD